MTVRTKLINRRYRLERRISLTDTIETWLAFDNVLHRAVAVAMPRQELLRDGAFLAQFLQRSRIATALHHRGIVAAFDSGEDGDTPYLITEYLGGESLADIVRTESPFDVDDVAILVDQVAGALDYAHQRGFVHGRLRSEDVIVDGEGATKLIGLGVPIGSVSADGGRGAQVALTIESDIAALGAIAFEMLTGEAHDSFGPDSAGEAYLVDPDVPRNASDVVTIALGSGSAQFTTAGAFGRSLTGWRSFDPAEYFIAPQLELDWPPLETPTEYSRFLPSQGDPNFSAGWDELLDSTSELELAPRSLDRRNLWLFAALLVLIVAAGILVWQSSEPSVGASSTLPIQIESLAQLSGF